MGAAVLGTAARGQTHKVAKPEAVVRAVGVYEWTGDLNKPEASRLIPVSLYIHGELEDAAVYQPQPIPFALLPGNAYELQQAGVAKGLVELASAAKLDAGTSGYDNVWFGYGTFRSEAAVKQSRLRVTKSIDPITTGKDDPAETNTKKGRQDDTNKVDPDRPTLRRRGPAGKGDAGKGDAGKAGAPEASTTAGAPPDDPDRPVLKKHEAPPPAGSASGAADAGTQREIDTESLNNDPNRPSLHRGRPAGGTSAPARGPESSSAKASPAGLPTNLHQMVAVSDAATRSEHDFTRPWGDEAEHKAVLAKMEAMARERLAGYAKPAAGSTSATVAAAPATAASRAGTTVAARRRAAAQAAAATAGAALLDEDLRGYTLSYGGAPTFVYTAHTAGTGEALRYVTLVGQQDTAGQLQAAFASVTDAAHLDRTPWMRLVGVVDAEATNRASLLFEMRESRGRQFALYQVLGARSETLFTSGTTQ